MVIQVNVVAQPSLGVPAFVGELDRINVILGANGAGKSKLLSHFLAQAQSIFGSEYTPVVIEGGRAVVIPIDLQINNQNMSVYSNATSARVEYKNQRRSTLSSRMHRTFVMLRALEIEEKAKHSDAVHVWSVGDRAAEIPLRKTPPLMRLSELFNDIFPQMKIDITIDQQIFIKKTDAYYPVSSMSEGEKQILALLADIVVLTNEKSVFIIDEPELNLHPSLAEKFWTSIEDHFPEGIFVYASHSLSFALRDNVDSVFAIGHGKIDITSISRNSFDLHPFLGSIPGIVRSKHCLFVEGNEKSFDPLFYSWVMGRSDVEIVPVGSSCEVVAAASRQGIWHQVSSGINTKGVIDRDFKAETQIDQSDNHFPLIFHEAESLICHPDIVMAVFNALGNSTAEQSNESVVTKIVEIAQRNLVYVVAQRIFSRCQINLRPSIERSGVASITSINQLRPMVVAAATGETKKAEGIFDEVAVQNMISEEEKRCVAAITTRNVSEMLILFEGKKFLSEVCKMSGCAKPLGMLNAVMKHFKPEQFDHTKQLKDQLAQIFQ